MTIPIQPLADRVVAVKPEAKTQTASGLYLPTNSQEKSNSAEVVAIGPDVKTVKKGQSIIFKDYTSTEIKIDDTDYLIVKEEDILAVVKSKGDK